MRHSQIALTGYRRSDRERPTWGKVIDLDVDLDTDVGGIPGSTIVPNPNGPGDSLLFVWAPGGRSTSQIMRLDPDGSRRYTQHNEFAPCDLIVKQPGSAARLKPQHAKNVGDDRGHSIVPYADDAVRFMSAAPVWIERYQSPRVRHRRCSKQWGRSDRLIIVSNKSARTTGHDSRMSRQPTPEENAERSRAQRFAFTTRHRCSRYD